MVKRELCPILPDYLVLRIIHKNVVYIRNRYSGMHTWLLIHHCTVSNKNRKYFDLKIVSSLNCNIIQSLFPFSFSVLICLCCYKQN